MAEISVCRGECFAHLASPGGRSLRVSPEPCLPPSPPHLLLCLPLHPWCPVKTDLPLAHERNVLILRQGALSTVTACANAGPSDHKHLSSQSAPRDSCGLSRPQGGHRHCGKLQFAERLSSGRCHFWLFTIFHRSSQHPRLPCGQTNSRFVQCW